MMRAIVSLIAIVAATTSFAQKKVATVSIPSNVAYAAVDRPGDLYVVMTGGETLKFDKNGKQIGKKKFDRVPTIFDPKDGTRAFAYSRDKQTLESIAPDLSFSDTEPVHPEFAVSAWLVCPSKNEFWILDSADFSIKKTKGRGTAIAYESQFSETIVSNIQYMREYLNFLFVLDRVNGIHVLNNLGKDVHKIGSVNIPYFSFLGEEIYYPSGNTLQLFDLYTTEKREISLPHPAQFALLTDERMMLIKDRTIEFFEFTP